MTRIWRKGFCLLLLVTCQWITPSLAFSQDSRSNVVDGLIDPNYYYDTRDFNVLTINSMANFKRGMQYFSFVNYTNPADAKDNADLESFYTEQNLRWALPKNLPFNWTTQYVTRSGAKNDLIRFGAMWWPSKTPQMKNIFDRLNMQFFINFHPIQVDHLSGFNWQIEYVYRIQILPRFIGDRLYLSGFADQDLKDLDNHWVTEHQAGVRLADKLFLVAELRHNANLSSRNTGVGLGMEYLIAFK